MYHPAFIFLLIICNVLKLAHCDLSLLCSYWVLSSVFFAVPYWRKKKDTVLKTMPFGGKKRCSRRFWGYKLKSYFNLFFASRIKKQGLPLIRRQVIHFLGMWETMKEAEFSVLGAAGGIHWICGFCCFAGANFFKVSFSCSSPLSGIHLHSPLLSIKITLFAIAHVDLIKRHWCGYELSSKKKTAALDSSV